MKLKNIHSRRDFMKINEFLAGQEGGVGAHDGFANNAKLKDTYLGMLMNSMFKGISWLWRKSKENFIVNKMIGRLVNELFRGIILFCFANNIDLKNGQIAKKEETPAQNEDEQEDPDAYKTKTKKDWTIQDHTNQAKDFDVEQLRAAISEKTLEITGVEKSISDLKKQIDADNVILQNPKLPKDTKAKKERAIKNSQDQISGYNKDLDFLKQVLSVFKKELEVKNASASSTSTKKTINLQPIHDACVKKWNFNPEESTPPSLLSDMDIVDVNTFKNEYKDIPINLIKIGEHFKILYNGVVETVEVTGVEVEKNKVFVVGVENKTINGFIKGENLRSVKFPNYKKTKNKILKYLTKNVDKYPELPEEDQKKIEKVYMAYSYIKNLVDNRTVEFGVNESSEYDDYDLLTEANETTAVKEEPVANKEKTSSHVVPTGSSVKTKPDEARAGEKATTIPLNSASVNDILTRRDRDKNKDKSDQFAIKVNEINLAEIEKTLENVEVSGSTTVRTDVAKMVNPYNLKVIQLTVDKLMLPKKYKDGTTEPASDPNLKIKWKQKLDGTYAAFYKIMDTKYINDIMEKASTLSEIDGKLSEKIDKSVNNISEQTHALGVASQLPVSSKETVNISSISKDGYWCYYNFLYKKVSYNSVITPVSSLFIQGAPLMQLTSFFDIKDGKTSLIDKKREIFTSQSLEGATKSIKHVDIYFLLKNNQIFPDAKVKTFKVLVLNEIEFDDGTKQLFVLVNKEKLITGDNGCLLLTDELIKKVNIDKEKYIHNIDSVYFARFNKIDFPKSQSALGVTNTGFSLNKKPDTINDIMTEKLKELSTKLF
jgi:hypothetical protein